MLMLWILLYFSTTDEYEIISNYKITNKRVKRSSDKAKLFNFNFANNNFNLLLHSDCTVFTKDFDAYSIANKSVRKVVIQEPIFYKGKFNKFEAFVNFNAKNIPQALFYSPSSVFYIEPAWRHIPSIRNESILIGYYSDEFNSTTFDIDKLECARFDNSDSTLITSQFLPSCNNTSSHGHYAPYKSSKRAKRAKSSSTDQNIKKRCTLLLIADWRFYRAIGNNDVHNTINYIVGVIGRMNAIFTRSKFHTKDDPNKILTNYGFAIRQIIIHTHPTINSVDHFDHNVKSSNEKSFGITAEKNLHEVTNIDNKKIYIHKKNGTKNRRRKMNAAVDSLTLFTNGSAPTLNITPTTKLLLENSRNKAKLLPANLPQDARRQTLKSGGYSLNEGMIFGKNRPFGPHTYISIDHYNTGAHERWENVGKLLESFSIHRPRLIVPKSKREEDDMKNMARFMGVSGKISLQSDVCLAHLFTHQPFKGNVLGLAYVASDRLYRPGGICTNPYTLNYLIKNNEKDGNVEFVEKSILLNTGFSSYQNEFLRTVFTQEGDIITAHEFGHNWGSEHDGDQSRNNLVEEENDGSYIMHPFSLRGYDANNKRFSPQSLLSIGTVLQNKAQLCFVLADDNHLLPPRGPPPDSNSSSPFFPVGSHDRSFYPQENSGYCGNMIVEPGEECDVGFDLSQTLVLASDFQHINGSQKQGYMEIDVGTASAAILRADHFDSCCDVRTCRLKRPRASCSDKNSACCLNCKPAALGMKCRPTSINVEIVRGNNSTSLFLTRYKDQNHNNYNDLRLLFERENLVNGVGGQNYGLDESCYTLGTLNCTGTTGDCPSLTISIDPLHETYRLSLDPRKYGGASSLEALADEEGVFKFIKKASPCTSYGGKGFCDGLGKCLPFCEFHRAGGQRSSCLCTKPNEACMICCRDPITKHCKPYSSNDGDVNFTTPIKLNEGEPCHYGYCDKKAICQQEFTDQVQKIWNYIEEIDINNFRKLMKDNLVGTIVILSAFLWIPISYFINSMDVKRDEELKRLQIKFLAKHAKLINKQDIL